MCQQAGDRIGSEKDWESTHIIHEHYDEIWPLHRNCTVHTNAQQNSVEHPSHCVSLPFTEAQLLATVCVLENVSCYRMLDHVTHHYNHMTISIFFMRHFPCLFLCTEDWIGSVVAWLTTEELLWTKTFIFESLKLFNDDNNYIFSRISSLDIYFARPKQVSFSENRFCLSHPSHSPLLNENNLSTKTLIIIVIIIDYVQQWLWL